MSELIIVCPHCGTEHVVSADRIISIVCDKGETESTCLSCALMAGSAVSDVLLECAPDNSGTLFPNRCEPDCEAFKTYVEVVELNLSEHEVALCQRC